MAIPRLWIICAVVVATATSRSVVAQVPPDSGLPYSGVVRNLHQESDTASGPGWDELYSITRRLEAIETENTRLRAETHWLRAEGERLRQVMLAPAGTISPASYLNGFHRRFSFLCSR